MIFNVKSKVLKLLLENMGLLYEYFIYMRKIVQYQMLRKVFRIKFWKVKGNIRGCFNLKCLRRK